MMSLFRTRSFREVTNNPATRKFHLLDLINGSSPIIYPDDEEFKSDRPSTSSSTRSRSDRRPAKFKQDRGNVTKGQKSKVPDSKGTGASSSGLSLEERARSLLLPTTDEAEGPVPRERSEAQGQGDGAQDDDDSVPSTIDYPEHTSADLVIFDDSSWCFLSDTLNWLPTHLSSLLSMWTG